jgi:hypothetical protein
MIKAVIYQEDKKVPNLPTLSNLVSEYNKQNLIKWQGEIKKYVIIVEDFYIHHSVIICQANKHYSGLSWWVGQWYSRYKALALISSTAKKKNKITQVQTISLLNEIKWTCIVVCTMQRTHILFRHMENLQSRPISISQPSSRNQLQATKWADHNITKLQNINNLVPNSPIHPEYLKHL